MRTWQIWQRVFDLLSKMLTLLSDVLNNMLVKFGSKSLFYIIFHNYYWLFQKLNMRRPSRRLNIFLEKQSTNSVNTLFCFQLKFRAT